MIVIICFDKFANCGWVSAGSKTHAKRVDYIAAENPYTDEYYSFDTNPFDSVAVNEHRIEGLSGHETAGRGVMDQIGTLIYNLILGTP